MMFPGRYVVTLWRDGSAIEQTTFKPGASLEWSFVHHRVKELDRITVVYIPPEEQP